MISEEDKKILGLAYDIVHPSPEEILARRWDDYFLAKEVYMRARPLVKNPEVRKQLDEMMERETDRFYRNE